MAKGPIVTDAIKVLIAKVYRDHRSKWKAPKVRNEVSYILHKDNPKLPKKFPSLSAVQKVLATLRQPIPPNPLDNPWHLGLLREYPHISAEAVRHIDEVQRAMRSFFQNVPVNPDAYHITVRQALWVARLYDIAREHVETNEPRERFKNTAPDDPHVLLLVAFHYADYELLCDLANISCDTSELDSALSHGLQQFYDFVSKQNAQSLRKRYIIPVNEIYEEGHKQPHKMNENRNFVFDPDCPVCKDREFSGSWHKLRMSVSERQRAKLLSKNDKKGKPKKEGGTK